MYSHQKVTPYSSQVDSKKSQVTKMFDRIAPYYDQLNRFLSLGIDVWWRKKAIDMLPSNKENLIIDIATGTGDLALQAAKKIAYDKIIGIDVSSNMIEVGKKKIFKTQQQERITLEIGDSEGLRFESHYFNIAMSAFGVRNFENLEVGLSEMYRVLKENGTIMVLEFSKPRIFPLKQLFNLYFKNILPVIGRMRSKDNNAYTYLYESVQKFPEGKDFERILQKVGFKETSFTPLTFGICTVYIGKK